MISSDGSSPRPVPERPYHAKRPHRKSRAGCRSCKSRKVKCDEVRPSCRNCTMRREDCSYPNPPSSPKPDAARSVTQSRRSGTPETALGRRVQGPLVLAELPLHPGRDETDMRCLWFFTTKTYESFCSDPARTDTIDVLRLKVVHLGFRSPFLMDTLLALAALHMKYLDVPIPEARVLTYRARAFQGYRTAVEEADPQDYPALLPASLLLCAVASAHFRESDAPPLYILHWMLVWHGIKVIIELVRPEMLFKAGMHALFFRPPIDLNTAALCIPCNLLTMVASLHEGDEDYPHLEAYYNTLKYLGSLYQELEAGFSAVLDLRIITFFTFLRHDFVDLARARRPRALVIIAHYLAFAKTIRDPGSWWMFGIADRDIENICHLLGDHWAPVLAVPRAVAQATEREDMARLLLDRHAWERLPPEDREEEHDRLVDPSLVDDTGMEITFNGGFYQVPTRQRPVFDIITGTEEPGGDLFSGHGALPG